MATRSALALLALTTPLLLAPGARAFGVLPGGDDAARWPSPTISFELDDDGISTITDGSDVEAVRSAMRSWSTIDCSALELVESGPLTGTQNVVTGQGVTDGINRVLFVEDDSWPVGFDNTLALTLVSWDSGTGEIFEADVAFNGFSQGPWTTDGSGGVDVENVAVHELGHLIGLRHWIAGSGSFDDPPTMMTQTQANLDWRSLHADDMAAACYLYPDAGYTCDADCDCPTIKPNDVNGVEHVAAQMVCDNGSCAMPAGADVALGEPCGGDVTCASGLFCQVFDLGAFCTQNCTPNTADACPTGLACHPGGVCMPGDLSSRNLCLADVGATNGDPAGPNPDPDDDDDDDCVCPEDEPECCECFGECAGAPACVASGSRGGTDSKPWGALAVVGLGLLAGWQRRRPG